MKKTALFIILSVILFSACGQRRSSSEGQLDSLGVSAANEPEFEVLTTMGSFKIKLYSQTPKHRANFTKLVEEHYYDSLLIHRIVPDFIIQTGDPYTRDSSQVEMYGYGGPSYTVPAEFVPEYTHKRGAIAAARTADLANPMKESSGSQFYIVVNEESCKHLNGGYTVFGEVVSGMDVIDRISTVPVDKYDFPLREIRIKTIRKVVSQPRDEENDMTKLSVEASKDGELTKSQSESHDNLSVDKKEVKKEIKLEKKQVKSSVKGVTRGSLEKSEF